MKHRIGITLLAAFFCTSPLAEPAPWFKWRSLQSGDEVCTQTSPGEGWEKVRGPFKDARCDKRGTPGW